MLVPLTLEIVECEVAPYIVIGTAALDALDIENAYAVSVHSLN